MTLGYQGSLESSQGHISVKVGVHRPKTNIVSELWCLGKITITSLCSLPEGT